MAKHFRTCNLCEAMCGIEVEYEGDKVISIKGDKNDPFSRGYICPKAVALQDLYEDEDRLRRPIRKTKNGQWEEVSWEFAFDDIADRLKKIQNEHGPDSVGIYQGNPNVHNLGAMLYGPKLARSLRTRNKFSATSADQLPHHMVSQMMFGHLLLVPVPDIDRTDFFLVFGANPVISNGSMMSAAGMPTRLKELKKRGGRIVVIDPRKTETAGLADEHYFVRPGSDVYVLIHMIKYLLEKKSKPEIEWVKGLDELKKALDKIKFKVEELSGISQESIEHVVDAFCAAKTAVCYGRMGVSTQEYGTLCQYLITVFNLLTGNFDTPGGQMFPKPAVEIVKATGSKGTAHKFNRWQSRVRGLPEFGGELPVSCLSEEILTEGEGQIKAMVTNAGNPVLSTSNGIELDRALASLDFMVSIDIYINETTRHANYILPPASGLEVDHYDLVFNNLAVRNRAKYSKRLFPPSHGAKYDWQIYSALAEKLRKPRWTERILNLFLSPARMLDVGLKRGPYKGLSLSKLKKEPHGIDLGPLESCMPERLFTLDKMIDLSPKAFLEELAGIGQSENRRSLTLIGRRQLRSNNSWMHNYARLMGGKSRFTALLNTEDAADIGVIDGQDILVSSKVGSIKLKAEVTDEIMRGVVSIPHGWGHDRPGINLSTAEEQPGASINDLIDNQRTDSLSGNAAFSAQPVSVELAV